VAEATHRGTEIQRAHHLRCNSSRLNHIDQFRLLRGVALKAQTALLGAQGKTVFDPDFDIDDSGLPHEKPAIPAIECTQRVISRHNGPFRVMSALLLIERFQPGLRILARGYDIHSDRRAWLPSLHCRQESCCSQPSAPGLIGCSQLAPISLPSFAPGVAFLD
jgi:hypothetical protein